MALEVAWQRKYGTPLQIESENDCLMVGLPHGFEAPELLGLVRPDNVEALLRERLEQTGFFGARFRENAGRALLLPRASFRRRVPLWLIRQRAKKLLESVSGYEDFPILLETWRACLKDEFDLESLKVVLDQLAREEIRVSEARTSAPSPFAANLIWKQTNRLMYEDDTPEAGSSALRGDLLKELVFSSSLRPQIPRELRDRFQRKLHRTFPGYAPRSAVEILDWVRERILLPESEWRELLDAVDRDLEEGSVRELVAELGGKVVRLERRTSPLTGPVVALESLPRLVAAGVVDLDATELLSPLTDEPLAEIGLEALPLSEASPSSEVDADPLSDLVAEWLRSYGPLSRRLVETTFEVPAARLEEVLAGLVEDERLVVDRFGDDVSEVELCDPENLERLLRLMRAEARPRFEALPLERLPLHLAVQQRLGTAGAGLRDLQRSLETLFMSSAPAGLWETDLLPARLDPYYPSWLDSLLQESDLTWVGTGKERLTFLFPSDLDLLRSPAGDDAPPASEVLPGRDGRWDFSELAESSDLDAATLTERLWDEAWRGRIANTGFSAVRTGVLNGFRAIEERASSARVRRGRLGRRRFERWRSSSPLAGDWFRVSGDERPGRGGVGLDALDLEELNKDRVRVLLDRYGVLFRELLLREEPAFQWSSVFRSLRLMELSGEVLAGQFFAGVPGLQFASPAAYRRLREGLPEGTIYWLNAVDPASPCGLALEGLKGVFPRRVPSNHVVFHGSRLVLASRRNAGELDIRVEPDHPHLLDYIGFMKVLLTRQFKPLKVIELETINGEPAPTSPYGPPIAGAFTSTRDHRSIKLRRDY